MHPLPEWRVEIEEHGRSGLIRYLEPGAVAEFHWEFGGDGVVAVIRPVDAARWAGERRVLHRVAAEVIRQKAPACTAEYQDDGTVLIRLPKRR